MNIFENDLLEPVKEPTHQDVIDALNMVFDKAPKWTIIEEFEEIADYILVLEKALEKNGIALDKDDMNKLRFEDEEEFKKEKKWLLLNFVGKIIKKEGP